MSGNNGNNGHRGGNPNADKSRVGSALVSRVLSSAVSNMAREQTGHRVPRGLMAEPDTSEMRRERYELLDLTDPADAMRWQVIHNDKERYEIIEEKVSTVRASNSVDYACLIKYYELGENLPLVKNRDELRRDDRARLKELGFIMPDDSGSWFPRGGSMGLDDGDEDGIGFGD